MNTYMDALYQVCSQSDDISAITNSHTFVSTLNIHVEAYLHQYLMGQISHEQFVLFFSSMHQLASTVSSKAEVSPLMLFSAGINNPMYGALKILLVSAVSQPESMSAAVSKFLVTAQSKRDRQSINDGNNYENVQYGENSNVYLGNSTLNTVDQNVSLILNEQANTPVPAAMNIVSTSNSTSSSTTATTSISAGDSALIDTSISSGKAAPIEIRGKSSYVELVVACALQDKNTIQTCAARIASKIYSQSFKVNGVYLASLVENVSITLVIEIGHTAEQVKEVLLKPTPFTITVVGRTSEQVYTITAARIVDSLFNPIFELHLKSNGSHAGCLWNSNLMNSSSSQDGNSSSSSTNAAGSAKSDNSPWAQIVSKNASGDNIVPKSTSSMVTLKSPAPAPALVHNKNPASDEQFLIPNGVEFKCNTDVTSAISTGESVLKYLKNQFNTYVKFDLQTSGTIVTFLFKTDQEATTIIDQNLMHWVDDAIYVEARSALSKVCKFYLLNRCSSYCFWAHPSVDSSKKQPVSRQPAGAKVRITFEGLDEIGVLDETKVLKFCEKYAKVKKWDKEFRRDPKSLRRVTVLFASEQEAQKVMSHSSKWPSKVHYCSVSTTCKFYCATGSCIRGDECVWDHVQL